MRILNILATAMMIQSSSLALAQEKPDSKKFASTNDYPTRALREGREGTVHFRVVVGVDGRVKSCAVLQSSGHADLDYAACSNVTQRARFDPARDADGNPIEGTFASKIDFRIPKD